MRYKIEIYPSETKEQVFNLVRQKIENYTKYTKYSLSLTFKDNGIIVDDFYLQKGISNNISYNQVVSPYCEYLHLDADQIDEVFTARDIVEDLPFSNGNRIDNDFIEKFERVGVYYNVESKGAISNEEERNLFLLIASALADITAGLLFFDEGSEECGFGKPFLMTADEFYRKSDEIMSK